MVRKSGLMQCDVLWNLTTGPLLIGLQCPLLTRPVHLPDPKLESCMTIGRGVKVVATAVTFLVS